MKKSILSLVGAAAVLAVASSTYANPLGTAALRYSFDGGTSWTTIVDNDTTVGSSDAAFNTDGAITAIIQQSGFSLLVTGVGTTKPQVGSAANPYIDLGLQGGGTGSGQLIVEFSDIGFGPIPQGSYVTGGFITDTGINATAYTIIGAGTPVFSGADFSGGNLVSTAGVIAQIGPVTTASINQSSVGPNGQSDPYSITLVQVFDLSRTGGGISTDIHLTSVPDGGNTLMLLGSALSVLGLGVFRSSRKAAVKA